jgi:protein ImuB
VDHQAGASRLVAVDKAAVALGLRSGLTLADARARVPALAAQAADPQADARFLLWLGQSCECFSPSVALDPPDGLVLDVTGCAHLFGGEVALHEAVRHRLERAGVTVLACLAGTPDAARMLVRHARVPVVAAPREESLVRGLPVKALDIAVETAVALIRAGLKTLGDLADRPSVLLSARFGEDLPRKLARALGREEVPLVPLRPAPALWVERRFADPMTHVESLHAVLASLLDEAARELEARGQGGQRFEATYFRSDGAIRRIVVGTGRPTRDPDLVARLYRERFAVLADPLDPGFGFDALRLAVPVTEPLAGYQPDLDGGSAGEANVAALLDRLAARFGRDRVIRFAARDTHDPDREARLRSALAPPAEGAGAWRQPEPGEPPLRPLHVFRPPQPIEAVAEVPDGPPARFRWRRVWRDVTRAEGPERIEPEWWRCDETCARDYYRIEDAQGRRYWVFRRGFYGEEEDVRWFLHGLFA